MVGFISSLAAAPTGLGATLSLQSPQSPRAASVAFPADGEGAP